MKTLKIVFVLITLMLAGFNANAEKPQKVNLAIAEQSNSGYYIHGLDYVYNQVGKRFTIVGDKPANVRVDWDVDQLVRVTQNVQYIVVVRGNAQGLQNVRAHVYGDNIDIILTKQVTAVDAEDPHPSDSGYIEPWW